MRSTNQPARRPEFFVTRLADVRRLIREAEREAEGVVRIRLVMTEAARREIADHLDALVIAQEPWH